MKWKDPRKELPMLDKSYRCLGYIIVGECKSWRGYVDIYFSAISGWRRCETNEIVEVIKWIYIEEFESEFKDV